MQYNIRLLVLYKLLYGQLLLPVTLHLPIGLPYVNLTRVLYCQLTCTTNKNAENVH